MFVAQKVQDSYTCIRLTLQIYNPYVHKIMNKSTSKYKNMQFKIVLDRV